MHECSVHSPWARKPRTFRNACDGKIRIIEEALGTPDTERLRYFQRRRMKMLGKQTRQVARPYSETFGEHTNSVPIQSTGLNQDQSPLHGCLGTLPRWTKRRRFGTAAEAGAIAGTLRGGSGWIELYIARERGPRPADGAAVDSRALDRCERYPVQSGIAPLQGVILSGEVKHKSNYIWTAAQCELYAMTESENVQSIDKKSPLIRQPSAATFSH
jgi:hypothetical protein